VVDLYLKCVDLLTYIFPAEFGQPGSC
jgi:hypothetical protein